VAMLVIVLRSMCEALDLKRIEASVGCSRITSRTPCTARGRLL